MITGHLHPAFSEVGVAFRRQLKSNGGGAAVSIYHRGERVVDIWGGYKNGEGAPWEEMTMAPSFSTTKGIASTVVHILADQGLVDYDEFVCTYWPEFGQAGKERITVRQVLAHESGLYHVRQMVDHADRMLDWEHMIKAIEQTPPLHEPGTRMGYHGLTYGYLVGEIIERVTDKPFREVVEEVLTKPLELDGLYIGGTPKSELRRAAQLIGPDGGKRKGLELAPTTCSNPPSPPSTGSLRHARSLASTPCWRVEVSWKENASSRRRPSGDCRRSSTPPRRIVGCPTSGAWAITASGR
jgi:CubicO group peptidase (beta-lactamase class C family)